MKFVAVTAALGVALAAAVGCGGSDGTQAAVAKGGSVDQSKWPADDRSMCNFRNNPELEVSETAGPGALRPNVRRVYKVFGGAGEARRKTLVCREVDTNLDGLKDVVRTFNAKGEAVHEESDRNYDGRIDIWINFVEGRLAQEDIDTNLDGKPDVWKFYVDGQLNRIRRDRNFDGKPDVWEMYRGGKLERVGVDETFDGHVDRWDRDEQMKAEQEAAEKRALAAMEAAKDAGAPPPAADAGK
ncbi:MAG: hypothetical protein U0183_00325 [Polyangiaceae bacterium]|jgi:hypothetical protein